MTCDLLAFPSEFKAGLDLLPLNFKLGLKDKHSQDTCDYSEVRMHKLLYDHQRAEDKCVNVVCHNGINNSAPIEMRKFCLGFSQCLSGGTVSISQINSTVKLFPPFSIPSQKCPAVSSCCRSGCAIQPCPFCFHV